MLITSFAIGASTPSHNEDHISSNQLKIEVAASQRRATLELEQSNQILKQHAEAYIQAQKQRFERYHASQTDMSKDIKELLRREAL